VHRAGEKAFVDFSGKKPRIHDRETGEATEVELFVMVLGASSYTYAEATRTQQVGDFVGATVNGLEYFEGVPELLVPDQLRSAVSRPDRIEPEIQATFAEMAQHYGTAVVPARPRKPRDKAKVEAAVRLAQRWILGCLRHRRFFSLEELNAAIRELLEKLNTKPFQKLEGCRRSAYEKLDRPALKPLPSRRYELSEWKLDVGVNVDYHVEYDHRLYSVPCALLGARVDVRSTRQVVELWHGGVRVASHERSYGPKGTAVTKPEHRPQAHREWGNWPPERLVSWASQTGPNTAKVVESILGHQTHPETGRRACLGLMRLVEKYGAKRVEAACERAIQIGNPKYKSVAAILKNGLDKTAWKEQEQASPVVHENIRGGAYFDRGETESVDTTKEETEGEIGAGDLDEERIAIMNEPRLESTRRERVIRPEEGREESTEGASLGAAQVASPRARREPLTELIARLQTLWSSPMRVQKSREEPGHKEGCEGGPRRSLVDWQQESHSGAVERRAGPRERESAETRCGVEDPFGGRLCYWRGEA